MPDDPFMAGREPGESILDYEKRMGEEADALGITVTQHKDNLAAKFGKPNPQPQPEAPESDPIG